MTAHERARHETLLRVANFGSRYGDRFTQSPEATQAFAKVAEVATRIDADARLRLLAAREGRKVKAAARRAVFTRMLAIARTARGLVAPGAAVDHGLHMPLSRSGNTLRQAAQVFLDEGARVKHRLVRLGLPDTFLDDLRLALDQFTSATTGRHSGRSDVAKTRHNITAALREGFDALRVLDIVVTNVVGDDPGMFAAWRRDRRVVSARAARTSRADAPPEIAPVVTTGEAPAAPSPESQPETSPPLALVPVDAEVAELDKAS